MKPAVALLSLDRVLRTTVATIALLSAASDVWAWPTRPVVLLASSSAGSPVDLAARLVAEGLASRLGQPFVVDNRPGADGIIALEAIKAASPDGHHLLMTNIGALTVNPLLYAKLPYDPERDFTPVTIVAAAIIPLAILPMTISTN
jgi:tripartite-type tricarboxylate transporter receptor subunit TctC